MPDSLLDSLKVLEAGLELADVQSFRVFAKQTFPGVFKDPSAPVCHRRLAFVPDKEGKTRVVGIYDY